MLGDGDGLAEPADVAEVGEDRRRLLLGHEARRQLLAEQVLVADVGRDPLAVDDERGRVQAAAVEVAERDVHQLGEPAKAGRDELAERHQVVLVVAVEAARQRRGRGGDAGRRVGVAQLLVAERQADQGGPPGLAKALEQLLPPRPGRAGAAGAGSPSPGRSPGRRRRSRAAPRSRPAPAARGAWRTSPPGVRCPAAARPRASRPAGCSRCAPATAPSASVAASSSAGSEPGPGGGQAAEAERRRHPGGDRPEAVDADPGREAAERRIDLRIAARHPGKAGEDHAPGELGEQPGAGEHRRRRQRRRAAPARHRRHRRGEVEGEKGAEREHRQRGQPRRQAAVAMHADEHPPGAGAEPCGAEGPAEKRRPPRRGGADPPGEERDRQQLQRPEGGVDEGDRLRRRRAAAMQATSARKRRRLTRRRSPGLLRRRG